MSKMGEPSLLEVRNMIKHISEDVSSIKGQLSEIIGKLDPNRQHDFSPDEGDHRWPGLDKIKISSRDRYPWNLANSNTTAEFSDEEEG